ncbi:MAG TPA: hypothetical protein VFP68_24270 [Burkholderiaceae bacterium]|nr:hypothetical protein [Burkholderiaceae bacterium]
MGTLWRHSRPTSASLTFVADSAVAGKYSLVSTSAGAVKTAGPITVGAGASVTTNFSFP